MGQQPSVEAPFAVGQAKESLSTIYRSGTAPDDLMFIRVSIRNSV